MRYDFQGTDMRQDFTNLAPGWYTIAVHEVREGRTREGEPRWGLKLLVAEGAYTGRYAAWDGMVWSERGARRTRQVLEALGVDASGVVDIEPSALLGRTADVQLAPEEYEHPVTGRVERRNRVTYDGWASAGSARAALAGAGAAGSVDGWGGEGESCAHECPADGSDPAPF
ncbi:MAG: hypothetical protein H6828_10405 [Planctomycetes bacterium]|nr:hypothetical protein [Planctomycetota bacterium]